MSERKKLFLIFIFTFFNIFLIIGFLIINDAVNESNLKSEIRRLDSLEISEDRFNVTIKSRGDYEFVESAIKTYYDEYAMNLQAVLNILESDEFKRLLLIDNLKKITSNYDDSFKYIKITRREFNKKIEILILMSDINEIKNNIFSYIDDEYYVDLYNDLMFNSRICTDIINNKDDLIKLKEQINNNLNLSEEILTFLIENKSKWKIEEEEIKFDNKILLDKYNILISKLK